MVSAPGWQWLAQQEGPLQGQGGLLGLQQVFPGSRPMPLGVQQQLPVGVQLLQQVNAPLPAAPCQGDQPHHYGLVEPLAPTSAWTSVQLPFQRPAGEHMLNEHDILQLYVLLYKSHFCNAVWHAAGHVSSAANAKTCAQGVEYHKGSCSTTTTVLC